jgi:hypothetical protein
VTLLQHKLFLRSKRSTQHFFLSCAPSPLHAFLLASSSPTSHRHCSPLFAPTCHSLLSSHTPPSAQIILLSDSLACNLLFTCLLQGLFFSSPFFSTRLLFTLSWLLPHFALGTYSRSFSSLVSHTPLFSQPRPSLISSPLPRLFPSFTRLFFSSHSFASVSAAFFTPWFFLALSFISLSPLSHLLLCSRHSVLSSSFVSISRMTRLLR